MKYGKYAFFFLPLFLISGGCYKNEPAPYADFTFSANNDFTAPCTLQFSTQCADAYSYDWWFGCDSSVTTIDPPGSTMQNPSHLYAKPGKFSVTLRAYTASRKEWSSMIKTITIKDTVK